MTDPNIAAAIANRKPTARLDQHGDTWQLTMERDLAHPAERVWTMITDPTQLHRWSPVVPNRALDSVGPATSREVAGAAEEDAEVLQVDQPRLLVHRWGPHQLRWTLEPTDGGCLLRLEHTFGERPEAPSYGAGWHVCLGALEAALEHAEIDRAVGPAAKDYGWQRLHDAYADQFGSPS
ncbi:hypothetical protein CGZ93_03870 [Enemella dayhoffiae]|uniref:Activator of Hsp90 ATPase homologue 1/2-like C-terminal domain-containing protein n=1 Tax=Enemella dayhoffiae TaxID=2016507 RepID=A0A255H9M4_9ACTN|nr:SRPBCC family protein [Enemella dayhoffiae]OYO24257.1 hypothetical protein CGZ93_03870 [Enemella dayhoffiae]